MIRVRKSSDRGHFDHGWLDTYHTFSFSRYLDPKHMGFRALRVINEDRVIPGKGFGTHPHEDMEIITYVLEGGLTHRDSLGTGATIRPGELQCMTAGTGLTHSEFNGSPTEPVHLYQIWLLPEREGLKPSYEQRFFPEDERHNRLRLVASPDGSEESLTIRQDARLFLASLDEGQQVSHKLLPSRHAWLQVLRGRADLNGTSLAAGDGAAVSEESELTIRSDGAAEVMLFDLA
jgi:redox-sensitive bicupin YhaK (pirin superfamily)